MPEQSNSEFQGGESNLGDHDEQIFVQEYSKYLIDLFPWLQDEIAEVVLSTDSPYDKADLLTHIHQNTIHYFDSIRVSIGEDSWSRWENPHLHADPWKNFREVTSDNQSFKNNVGRALTRTGLIAGGFCLLGVFTKEYEQAMRAGASGVIAYNLGKLLRD